MFARVLVCLYWRVCVRVPVRACACVCVRACSFFAIITILRACVSVLKYLVVISSLNQFQVIVYFEFYPPQRIVFHKLYNYLTNQVPL